MAKIKRNNMTARITIRITDAELFGLTQIGRNLGLKLSDIVRKAIEGILDDRKTPSAGDSSSEGEEA